MYARDERVELIQTTDPHTRLTPGSQGTVRGYTDRPTPTLRVAWDDGSTLAMLLTEGDIVTRIEEADATAAVTVRPDRAAAPAAGPRMCCWTPRCWARRGYTARMIGQALVRAAQGRTHRVLAETLDVPLCTTGGWIRRARATAHQLWTLGVRALVTLDADALPPPTVRTR